MHSTNSGLISASVSIARPEATFSVELVSLSSSDPAPSPVLPLTARGKSEGNVGDYLGFTNQSILHKSLLIESYEPFETFGKSTFGLSCRG